MIYAHVFRENVTIKRSITTGAMIQVPLLQVAVAMNLLLVCGPSGSGKSTLVDRLVREYPTKYEQSTSYTTRVPRNGEVDGRDYNFVTVSEFNRLLFNGELVESSLYAGNYYGTSLRSIEHISNQGKCNTAIFEP